MFTWYPWNMPSQSTILLSTWAAGVFVLDSDRLSHELAGKAVCGLSDDLLGGAYAAVDGHHLFQRHASGRWRCIASSEHVLSVTFAVGGKVYVGTDDARVLGLDGQGELHQIDNFDSIEGRDSWFAGTAIIDGKEVGPPLGVRSISGTNRGRIFANVHVGGLPRSIDNGSTWSPTIEVDWDVHEVRVSPVNNKLVVAATASGLCLSEDGGDSWSLHTAGLHAPYCSAVAVTASSIFVAASESHFAQKGALYRRGVERSSESLQKVAGGLPDWLAGIADTLCIAANGDDMALASAGGQVFVSADAGRHWSKVEETVHGVSSVLIVR